MIIIIIMIMLKLKKSASCYFCLSRVVMEPHLMCGCRRKVANRQRRLQQEEAEGRSYQEQDQNEAVIAASATDAPEPEARQQILESHDIPDAAPDHALQSGRRTSERQKKSSAEYKFRQSLTTMVDKYQRHAGGKTEIALCISSSTQAETFWVHGRGLAMSSKTRRHRLGSAFKELVVQKRKEIDDGLHSEGEDEGGGGVREGNYSHAMSTYASFFQNSEKGIREQLRTKGLSASQQFVQQLSARIWHTLPPEDRSLINYGTSSFQALLDHHPSLWNEGELYPWRVKGLSLSKIARKQSAKCSKYCWTSHCCQATVVTAADICSNIVALQVLCSLQWPDSRGGAE